MSKVSEFLKKHKRFAPVAEKKAPIKIINCTNKLIRLSVIGDPCDVIFKPSGYVVRVGHFLHEESFLQRVVGKIPIIKLKHIVVDGMPEPQQDTFFVVNYDVFMALKDTRKDILTPDTSEDSVLCDDAGDIFAIMKFMIHE